MKKWWAWAAAALGQRLGGSVSSFSLLLNVPHPPNWKKKGEGTFSQTPPFPPSLRREKKGFGQKKLFPLLPFLRPKRCLSQAAPPPSDDPSASSLPFPSPF